MDTQKLTKKKEESFKKGKGYFEYSKKHPSMTKFHASAIESYGFYDGAGQWEEKERQEVLARGQFPVVVNKIQTPVNNLTGTEIQTRFRVAYRSHSGKEKDDALAKAITHYGYAVQESEKMVHKCTISSKDVLVTGLGWGNIFKDTEKGTIKYEEVDPLSVFYDPDDLSADLNNMTFVARTRWLSVEQAKKLWPKHEKYFDDMFEDDYEANDISGELAQRESGTVDTYTTGNGSYGSKILVVEVQYRETQISYCGFDAQGHSFQTFDREVAEELSEKKADIKEVPATQIMRIMYTGDRLLEYAPLEPRLPDLPDFTYIPCVYARHHKNGVPYGWIESMKDLQRESNYRRSKLINNLNSFRAIIDVGALGPAKNIEQLKEELKKPDSIILKSGEGEVNVESNQALSSGQFEMLAKCDQELQQVSGMYDEALGKQTNTQSGIGIKYRQEHSVRNQQHYFANLKRFKSRIAVSMLALIQGGGEEFIASHILTDEEKETIIMNNVREIGGKRVFFDDIRTLPLSIYVEEVPDYESFSQEQSQELEAILNNPNAPLILQSPALMKRLGIRDYLELSQEFEEISQKEAQQEQQVQGNVPPEMQEAMMQEQGGQAVER